MEGNELNPVDAAEVDKYVIKEPGTLREQGAWEPRGACVKQFIH